MDSEQMDKLEALAEAATKGPWAWMGNQHGLYLATTHSGRQYVMGFRRMGTQSAQPVFRVGNHLKPAADLVRFEVGDGEAVGFKAGRDDDSVYRYDVSSIDAPDAAYIAAASPDVILSLIRSLREVEGERDRGDPAGLRPLASVPVLASNGHTSAEPSARPWTVEVGDHTHRFTHIVAADELTVFYKYATSKAEAERDEANARLIVAAVNAL